MSGQIFYNFDNYCYHGTKPDIKPPEGYKIVSGLIQEQGDMCYLEFYKRWEPVGSDKIGLGMSDMLIFCRFML